MTKASDLDLLKKISEGGDLEFGSTDVLFKEFYSRYSAFLLKVCRKSCASFDSADLLADDIFQNTLIKVYKNAGKFNPKTDNEVAELKAWLTRIAYNELNDFLRKNPDEKNLSNRFRITSEDVDGVKLNEIEKDNGETSEKTSIKPNINKDALDFALKSLSEREAFILMAYMQYFDYDQPLKHIPDDLLKAICIRFNINSDNVRQIKSRALKKIKSEIEKYNSYER